MGASIDELGHPRSGHRPVVRPRRTATQTFFGNDATIAIATSNTVVAAASRKTRALNVSIFELIPAKKSTVANMIVIKT